MPSALSALAVIGTLAGCDVVFPLEAPPDPSGRICETGMPFAPGTEVPIDGSHSVEAARFTADQQLAYLSLCPPTGEKTGCELYTSPFSTTTQTFTGFSLLGKLSTDNTYDAYPTPAADRKHVLFGSERNNDGTVAVFVATAIEGSFDNPLIEELSLVTGMRNSNEPYVVGETNTIYFGAEPSGANRWDLFRASGPPPDFGGISTPVVGANGSDDELAPVVSVDEREIFFATNRSDPGGVLYDIFTATRDTATDAFSTPVPTVLSTAGADWPVWISADACDLYYINKTQAGVATLYVTHR